MSSAFFMKGFILMKTQHWKTSIARFLTAQTISLFGSSLVQYAIIWHITLSTSSGKMLMIATLCGFLPQLFISLFGGIWIDRYDRKKMIMLADSLIAFATFLLALAIMVGYDSILLLFAVLVIRSLGTGIQTPAVNALLPQIVPSTHLMKINGINSTLTSLIMFLSPVISGVLLSISLQATLFIDVLTAIIGISITATVRTKPHLSVKGTSSINDLKTGFLYLSQHPSIRNLLMFQLVILFAISCSAFLTPLLVTRTFGSEVWRLTMGEMTYSLGMVIGGILITTWGGFKKKLYTTLLAGAIYGLLMIGLGSTSTYVLYLIYNVLIGVTSPCYNAPITVSVQEEVESIMQGRVFSFMQIASGSAFPLGMVVFGPLSDIISVQQILMVTGCIVVLIVFVVWRKKYLDVH